ncbi:MAG TPA: hypothetical protein IAA95_04925 [Candidatus Aveggerthella excrementigallinarum]|nr:hypothetical protein [Candidatus Aveggerthella excrementigallinarum]
MRRRAEEREAIGEGLATGSVPGKAPSPGEGQAAGERRSASGRRSADTDVRGRASAVIPAPLAKFARKLQGIDKLLLLAIALFAAFTVVRTMLADFPKAADVMPDEMRYMDLARSLLTDGTLTIRGVQTTFQKILYPIALMPAMLFHDPLMQVKVMGFLNALYASSALFPAYVLARRIAPGFWPGVACLAIAALLPDLCYSMTFMSESLYLPLSLWLLVLLWDALEKPGRRGVVLAAAGGVLCYVAYLCKEVALAYVIVVALMFAARAVRRALEVRKEARARTARAIVNDVAFVDSFARMALFLAGFLLPFALMKLTLFAGMLNSYNQSSLDILQSLYVDVFAFHALALGLVHFALGFAFFPLVLPLVSWRHFPREHRTFLTLLALVLLVSFLTVVFTISMREDAGHVALRQHLRYVGPLLVPFAFYLVRMAAIGPRPRWSETLGRGHVLTVVLTAFCVGILLLFGTANLYQGLDSATLRVFRAVCELDAVIPAEKYDAAVGGLAAIPDDEPLLEINAAVWAMRAVIVALAAAGTVAFCARGRRGERGARCVVGVVLAFCLVNTVACCVHNREAYGTGEESVQEALAVDRALDALPDDAQVLIVYDDSNTMANNLVTTYVIDRHHTYRYVSEGDVRNHLADDGTLSASVLPGGAEASGLTPGMMEGAGSLEAPTYVLVDEQQKLHVSNGNALIIEHDPVVRFTLYCVPNGEPVRFDAG